MTINLMRNPKLMWGSLLGVGGVLYLKVWLPITSIGIPCVFHEITGLYCPGCGITRAVVSFIHFEFTQAFRFNPILIFLIPLYIAYTITNKQYKRTSSVIMTTMLVMTITFGLLRNIPAFDWLAPTVIN